MRRLLLAVVVVVALACPARGADFSLWNYRATNTFSGYNNDGTLTNFPVLIVLGTNIPGFSYANFASPNGYDLRFSDTSAATNELNYEIDVWNTASNSYVWVQVPALASNTDSIIMYYGNPGNTTRQPYTTNGATWNSSYRGVWHFNTNGTTLAFMSDSTTNGMGGTNVTTATPNKAAGVIDGASWYNATNHMDMPGQAGSDSITYSGWIYPTSSLTARQTLFDGFATAGSSNNLPSLEVGSGNGIGSNRLNVIMAGVFVVDTTNNVVRSNVWQHVVYAHLTGAVHRFYVNGVQVPTFGVVSSATYTNTSSLKAIGWRRSLSGQLFQGYMDEFRWSSECCSSNWVWTEWTSSVAGTAFTTYGTNVLVGNNFPSVNNLFIPQYRNALQTRNAFWP